VRILVFQHLCVEHPGALADFWREAGHEITTVELDEGEAIPPLDHFDRLVAMGGPMDVWQEAELTWLIAEKTAIRRVVVDLGRPCTSRTVAEWKAIPAYAASLEAALGPAAVDLEAEAVRRLPTFLAAARRLNDTLFAALRG
jgi:hypothetical protein